jgi:hypothetical protein
MTTAPGSSQRSRSRNPAPSFGGGSASSASDGGADDEVVSGAGRKVPAAVVVRTVALVVVVRLVVLVRDVVGRVVVVVVRVGGFGLVVVVAGRTESLVTAVRLPFGAVCLAAAVYRPADSDTRNRTAKLPSWRGVTDATVAPSSTIDTAEHFREEQKPSPNAVATSPRSTGFGDTRSCALAAPSAPAPTTGTRHNARTGTPATANSRPAAFITCRPYSPPG